MVPGMILIVLGVIFVYGSVTNLSILQLLLGKQVKNDGSSSTPTTGTAPSSVPTNVRRPGAVVNSPYVSPFASGYQSGRIDQGYDVSQTPSYLALGSGVVRRIATGWQGGTGEAVYVQLDSPITVNGRKYPGYYVAETRPLVQQGQRITAGQQIATGGSAELGFLLSNFEPYPATPGANTPQTQAGKDFYSFVTGL